MVFYFNLLHLSPVVFFWRLSNHIEKSIEKNSENYAIPTACCCMGKNVTDPKCAKKQTKKKLNTKITQKSICFIFPNNTLLKHLDANNAPEKKQEKSHEFHHQKFSVIFFFFLNAVCNTIPNLTTKSESTSANTAFSLLCKCSSSGEGSPKRFSPPNSKWDGTNQDQDWAPPPLYGPHGSHMV